MEEATGTVSHSPWALLWATGISGKELVHSSAAHETHLNCLALVASITYTHWSQGTVANGESVPIWPPSGLRRAAKDWGGAQSLVKEACYFIFPAASWGFWLNTHLKLMVILSRDSEGRHCLRALPLPCSTLPAGSLCMHPVPWLGGLPPTGHPLITWLW